MTFKKCLAFALVALVWSCEIAYVKVTSAYPVPVQLAIYTNVSSRPTEISLSPGQKFSYRDPSLVITKIEVKVPGGETKTYDSDALERISHQKPGHIHWVLRPDGVVAASP